MPHVADQFFSIRMTRRLTRGAFSAIAVCIALAIGSAAFARSSDRNQIMEINADHQAGTLDGNGVNTLSGNVTITQGTLDIRASKAVIHQRGGEPVRAVLTGQQAVLKQALDDGSPITARANQIDYDMTTDIVVLTGNFSVTTPRGTSSGQRLTYNLKTGQVESGGAGNGRVKIRIVPKSAQTTTPQPAPSKP